MAPNYMDGGHRPHARHTGEIPSNRIVEAPHHLSVTLDTWGPVDNLFPAIYDALQANWGDAPLRTTPELFGPNYNNGSPEARTGWHLLTRKQQQYVESCFAGKTLQQVLERITFSFLVDGCSRACTHQLVRTRIGAGMMQHGGRDNDWRHRPWVMPETIRRAIIEHDREGEPEDDGRKHCITDWAPINKLVDITRPEGADMLGEVIADYLQRGRDIYAALVDAGIPWEDARRLLWMGTATYIHIDYNYVALAGVLANRLEHIMDWEINCVAQLMVREIRMKCPPLLSKYLGSHSDRAGAAKFAGLQSWPPDGKYPNPYERCQACGHAEDNHLFKEGPNDNVYCEVCKRAHVSGSSMNVPDPYHKYIAVDSLPREHRPEQNPFWVLHPASMAGGPIVWIPTNGTYPHDAERGRP